jgi:hypothetical protein
MPDINRLPLHEETKFFSSLNQPLFFIKVPVTSQGTVMYLCVRGIHFTSFYAFDILFCNVPTM